MQVEDELWSRVEYPDPQFGDCSQTWNQKVNKVSFLI